MHIGIDASRLNITNRTGTENYTYNVIYHLARLQSIHDFRLYFRERPDETFWKELTNNNPQFHYRVISWPRLWTQCGLAFELLLHPVDVVFISSHTMPVLHRPSQRFVVTIHGLEYMYMEAYEKFPHKLYLTKSTEFVSRFADRIIAVSEFTKKSLLEHGWGATEDRIEVIPEGVSTDHFYPRPNAEFDNVLKKYEIVQPYFFFISTVQPRKNVLGLLEAYALFLAEHVEKCSVKEMPRLVLAGGHGYKFEEVDKAIKRFGLENAVNVLGRVPDEDVPALFSGAVASVYPSFVEGFGLPVLESMACGTPVVCSGTGALPEVGGDAALYVDPYDVESIAQSLTKVLEDRPFREDLVGKGLVRVRQFSWSETARKILGAFESLQ